MTRSPARPGIIAAITASIDVWSGPAAGTVGCTAMPEPALAQLIAGLDEAAVYVLLPRAEYDAFAAPWGLPAAGK